MGCVESNLTAAISQPSKLQNERGVGFKSLCDGVIDTTTALRLANGLPAWSLMRARRVDRVNTMQQRRRVWSPAQRRKCLTLLGFLG
jgi:hypothetical protein